MSLPARMSGVVLTRHGGPEALVWRDDLPVPEPGPGQVLVRVLAAGVNNTDIATREGWYAREDTGEGAAAGWAGAIAFPRIQGGDLCGRVVALGPGVEAPGIGRRVTCPINLPRPTPENPVGFIALGSEIDGAFAQFCRMEAADLHDVSAAPLSDVEIGAMPCAFGTAMNLLDRAGVTDGQRVLVTGASGGVGLAAVQLAAARGARVTGVAADLRDIYLRDIMLHGCTFQPPETLRRLVDLANAGAVRPLVSATYPLADITRAQEDFMSKRYPGKLVLIPEAA